MPETIRAANERLRSRPWRDEFVYAFVIGNFLIVPDSAARAEVRLGATAIDTLHRATAALRGQEITLLTLVLALLGLGLFASVVLLRLRRVADHAEANARDEIGSLQADVDRLKALLLSEPQILVTWAPNAEHPEILGDVDIVAP